MGPFERSFRQPGLPDVWQSREDGVSPPPPPISEVRLSHLLYTATSIHGMHVSILSQQQVLIRVDRSQVNQRPAGHPILRPLWIATCQTTPSPPDIHRDPLFGLRPLEPKTNVHIKNSHAVLPQTQSAAVELPHLSCPWSPLPCPSVSLTRISP
jgi:hypothetical protein